MERFAVKAETSPTFPSFPSKPNLRDVSFSSYLGPEEAQKGAFQSRVLSHKIIGAEDTEISIFEAEKYFNENPDQKQLQKPSNILDKIVEQCDYSSGSTINHRLSSVSSLDGYGRNYRTGSFNATPTASSEASWNSQTGLLSKPPGSIAVSMRNLPEQRKKTTTSSSPSPSSSKWLFRRKCPCSGKKSVEVEERFSQPRSPDPSIPSTKGCSDVHKQQSVINNGGVGVLLHDKQGKQSRIEKGRGSFEVEEITKMKVVALNSAPLLIRNSASFSPDMGRRVVPSGRPFAEVGGFSFPILNPPESGNEEDPPRESLEVFRPPHTAEETPPIRKSNEFQRRVLGAHFPGDVGRRSFTFPASPKGTRTPDDDIASDSSSDLFEIESFSTNATSSFAMYRRRESFDEMSRYVGGGGGGAGMYNFRRSLDETTTTTPTEMYEPSEVSVDWSVTTADGFGSVANFSASASEFGEARPPAAAEEEVVRGGGAVAKKRGTGLLSCQCEKAVSVGPHPVKCGPEQHIRMGPPRYPVESGRIAAMARLANGSALHVPRVQEKPSLARSSSARVIRTYISK